MNRDAFIRSVKLHHHGLVPPPPPPLSLNKIKGYKYTQHITPIVWHKHLNTPPSHYIYWLLIMDTISRLGVTLGFCFFFEFIMAQTPNKKRRIMNFNEEIVVLSHILRNFKFSLNDSHGQVKKSRFLILNPKPGVLKLRHRGVWQNDARNNDNIHIKYICIFFSCYKQLSSEIVSQYTI